MLCVPDTTFARGSEGNSWEELEASRCSGTLSSTRLSWTSVAILAQVLLALWHDRRQRSFNTNDIMMKTTVQNDLRLEMALESMWIVCAHEKSKQLRDNWKQACTCIELYPDKHIVQSTQIWLNWPLSHKLKPETLRFPQSRGSGYCCTQSRICSPLRSLPQSVELEYQRSALVVQVSQHIPRIPNPAAEASSVRAPQPRCTSHGFIPWSHSTDSHKSDSHCIERKIERKITSLLQRVIKQSDSPCLLQSTCCVSWTVWFPLSAPVASAVVTTSVSEWSDTLWNHGQPHSCKKSEDTKLVRIVTKREFTWHW